MNPISPYGGGAFPGWPSQIRPELPVANPQVGPADPHIGAVPAAPVGKSGVSGPEQVGFENLLGTFVRQVNAKHMEAADTVKGLLAGQDVPLHQAMVAMEEASVSFSLMLEVRNKLLEGYQELMRMQV